MKKLSRQELTERVAILEQMIYQQQQTIKVLDAASFLALYSLLHENKVYTPDFISSKQDIIDTHVSEAINKMIEIINKVEENNAQAGKTTTGNKSKSD